MFARFGDDDESTRIEGKILRMVKWGLRSGIIIKLNNPTDLLYTSSQVSEYIVATVLWSYNCEWQKWGWYNPILKSRVALRVASRCRQCYQIMLISSRHLFNSAPYFLWTPAFSHFSIKPTVKIFGNPNREVLEVPDLGDELIKPRDLDWSWNAIFHLFIIIIVIIRERFKNPSYGKFPLRGYPPSSLHHGKRLAKKLTEKS